MSLVRDFLFTNIEGLWFLMFCAFCRMKCKFVMAIPMPWVQMNFVRLLFHLRLEIKLCKMANLKISDLKEFGRIINTKPFLFVIVHLVSVEYWIRFE